MNFGTSLTMCFCVLSRVLVEPPMLRCALNFQERDRERQRQTDRQTDRDYNTILNQSDRRLNIEREREREITTQ